MAGVMPTFALVATYAVSLRPRDEDIEKKTDVIDSIIFSQFLFFR